MKHGARDPGTSSCNLWETLSKHSAVTDSWGTEERVAASTTWCLKLGHQWRARSFVICFQTAISSQTMTPKFAIGSSSSLRCHLSCARHHASCMLYCLPSLLERWETVAPAGPIAKLTEVVSGWGEGAWTSVIPQTKQLCKQSFHSFPSSTLLPGVQTPDWFLTLDWLLSLLSLERERKYWGWWGGRAPWTLVAGKAWVSEALAYTPALPLRTRQEAECWPFPQFTDMIRTCWTMCML